MIDQRILAIAVFFTCVSTAFGQNPVFSIPGGAPAVFSPSFAPMDAARSAAANQNTIKKERKYSTEEEFAASMRIQIQGDGIAVPADFNLGGRVTLHALPTDTRIKETGVAMPPCTEQSREGLAC